MGKNPIHDWLKTIPLKRAAPEVNAFDGRGALETITAGLAPLKALTVFQMEMIRWSSRRAQALLSIPQRLSGCKTQYDIFEEQKRFWETACAQNQETLERMVHVWSDLLGISFQASGLTKSPSSSDPQSLIKFPSKSTLQDGQNLMNSAMKPCAVYSS